MIFMIYLGLPCPNMVYVRCTYKVVYEVLFVYFPTHRRAVGQNFKELLAFESDVLSGDATTFDHICQEVGHCRSRCDVVPGLVSSADVFLKHVLDTREHPVFVDSIVVFLGT